MGYAEVARQQAPRQSRSTGRATSPMSEPANPGAHAAGARARSRPLRARRWPGAWSIAQQRRLTCALENMARRNTPAPTKDNFDVPARDRHRRLRCSISWNTYGEERQPPIRPEIRPGLGEGGPENPKARASTYPRPPHAQTSSAVNMSTWYDFYPKALPTSARSGNFDIKGQAERPSPRARLTPPCGKIPHHRSNESRG